MNTNTIARQSIARLRKAYSFDPIGLAIFHLGGLLLVAIMVMAVIDFVSIF